MYCTSNIFGLSMSHFFYNITRVVWLFSDIHIMYEVYCMFCFSFISPPLLSLLVSHHIDIILGRLKIILESACTLWVVLQRLEAVDAF